MFAATINRPAAVAAAPSPGPALARLRPPRIGGQEVHASVGSDDTPPHAISSGGVTTGTASPRSRSTSFASSDSACSSMSAIPTTITSLIGQR